MSGIPTSLQFHAVKQRKKDEHVVRVRLQDYNNVPAMLFWQSMVAAETLATESTVTDDPLSGLVAVDCIPTGIGGGKRFRGRRGCWERWRRDDDLSLTLLLGRPKG
jgi:hypothetical protein